MIWQLPGTVSPKHVFTHVFHEKLRKLLAEEAKKSFYKSLKDLY